MTKRSQKSKNSARPNEGNKDKPPDQTIGQEHWDWVLHSTDAHT